ncbi:MAG: hypothetical protein J6K86_04655 [Clostridia bacterium]|nr:hypothetical protein [Clostridia bacterium]
MEKTPKPFSIIQIKEGRELSYGRELTIAVVNCQLRWRELSCGRELQPAVALWLLFINFSATQNFVLLFTPHRGISRRSHFTKTVGFQFTPHRGISRHSHFTKTAWVSIHPIYIFLQNL